MQTTAEKVMISKAIIKKMYLDESDKRDWVVAYSGGKDSTAVAGLVVSVMDSLQPSERWRNVHLVMSDTQMENPLVHEHMVRQHRLLNEYAERSGLPLDCDIVSRDDKDSYFVLIIGKGYPLPKRNGSGRWCTDKLKIRPNATHVKAMNPSYILTGVRHAESATRSRSIDKVSISEYIAKHPILTDTLTLNPIVHWTVEDVWKFLEMEGLSWGSTLSVRTIYRDATGECGFTNPVGVEQKSVEVCGARHGCWNCPVVMKDKSTEKMAEKHEWLEPLTEWRAIQMKIYGDYVPSKPEGQNRKDRSLTLSINKEDMLRVKSVTKAGYNRRGQELGEGKGTLTLEARKYLYEKLVETERYMNRIRGLYKLPPVQLLSDEEHRLIKEHWSFDEQNNPKLIGGSLETIIPILEG